MRIHRCAYISVNLGYFTNLLASGSYKHMIALIFLDGSSKTDELRDEMMLRFHDLSEYIQFHPASKIDTI